MSSQTVDSVVYDALPGLEVKVGDALEQLSVMWGGPVGDSSSRAPSEFRASRMNLIVHFGFGCDPTEAQELFRAVLRFSRRYPCRVIALCGAKNSWEAETDMVCKIFSECYIGESGQDMSCCEALVFGYSLADRQYLENQISIFVESDLPTYYWPYGFDSPDLLSHYQVFFKNAQRIIFDSSRESYALDQVEIPEPAKIHDLAYSRLLSVRQGIGQFLSAYPINEVVGEIEEVILSCDESLKAEGRSLLHWIRSALKSAIDEDSAMGITFGQDDTSINEAQIRLAFSYRNENSLECVLDFIAGEARIVAEFGGTPNSVVAAIRLLEPEEALAEALFFS